MGDTISSREIWKMLLHSDHGWEYFIFFSWYSVKHADKNDLKKKDLFGFAEE